MKVNDIIERILIDAIFLEGFDLFDKEERKELSEKIAKELRKEFHIVPYAGQTSFE